MQTTDSTPTQKRKRTVAFVAGAPTKKPHRTKRETFTIGFRVDAYTLSKLEKGAAGYGISAHEYARQRLLELLERQEEAQLLEAVLRLGQAVEALRDETRGCFRETTSLLLTNFVEEVEPGQIRTEVSRALARAEESR